MPDRRPERQRVFINYSHQDNIGPDNPRSVTALEGYAALLQGTGRRQEADQMAARASAIRAQHQLPVPGRRVIAAPLPASEAISIPREAADNAWRLPDVTWTPAPTKSLCTNLAPGA